MTDNGVPSLPAEIDVPNWAPNTRARPTPPTCELPGLVTERVPSLAEEVRLVAGRLQTGDLPTIIPDLPTQSELLNLVSENNPSYPPDSEILSLPSFQSLAFLFPEWFVLGRVHQALNWALTKPAGHHF